MSERPVWQPTAEHPITVTPTGRHVTVTVNGVVVADIAGKVAFYPDKAEISLA